MNPIDRQLRFGAKQRAAKLLHGYSKADVRRLARIRKVAEPDLEARLAEEFYLIDRTNMELWPRSDLERLARRMRLKLCAIPDGTSSSSSSSSDDDDADVDQKQECTNADLVWLIAMTVVRDAVPYHITPNDRIVIDQKRVKQG